MRNLKPGDRVLIPSTIACGYCSYCREVTMPSATTPTPTAHCRHQLFRRPGKIRPHQRAAGGKGADSLCRSRTGEDSGRSDRRAGNSRFRHFSHRLHGRGTGRDQAGKHGGNIRLWPGRAVRHRQRQAIPGRANLCRGLHSFPTGNGTGTGSGSNRLLQGRPGAGHP